MCSGNLVYFVLIWYIFYHFGTLQQEKSGNPASKQEIKLLVSKSGIALGA
jgi:hypothetical protein